MLLNKQVRDLTLVEIEGTTLVIACDSAGAIGPKPMDRLPVSGELVGKLTAAVPLMEVMASGATPVTVINTLSVEMHPTGAGIIMGIRQAVAAAGLPLSILNGSTEENMSTQQTGVGVTVIGIAKPSQLRLGSSRPGDLVYCLGKPLVGQEVLDFPDQTAGIDTVRSVLNLPGVHEILPVGSKGIGYELEQLAGTAGLNYELLETAHTMDLQKSAGPATCLLVSVVNNSQSSLEGLLVPATPLARLLRKPRSV
ncbi:MAG: AIR synthase related protein [Bacillota bacterium]